MACPKSMLYGQKGHTMAVTAAKHDDEGCPHICSLNINLHLFGLLCNPPTRSRRLVLAQVRIKSCEVSKLWAASSHLELLS